MGATHQSSTKRRAKKEKQKKKKRKSKKRNARSTSLRSSPPSSVDENTPHDAFALSHQLKGSLTQPRYARGLNYGQVQPSEGESESECGW
ncbi:hypothetical protein VTK73DRAFT_6255 [Phialemonium thermophilum]|uniref:Uncharacterized protein n=1 Tax=Phialemonium thermophilum TaxID=223376 RepID=A0ABR3V002_9PEZI